MVRRPRVALLLLLLHEVELRVVACKLAQRDEEVAERKPELVVLRVEREEALGEGGDLDPGSQVSFPVAYLNPRLGNLRSKVGECVLQQGAHKVAQELAVASARLRLVGLVDRPLDLGLRAVGRVDKVEQAHEQHRLRLEPRLVVLIRQDKEDVLQDRDEELVEEGVGCLHVRLLGDVVDQLQAHVQPGGLDVAVVVLASP